MAREDVGEVVCAFKCGQKRAAVRANSKDKLYYNCPECGIVQPHGRRFQLWLLDNAKMYGPEGRPDDDAPAPVEPAPVQKAAVAPAVTTVTEVKKEPATTAVTKKSLVDFL